MPKLLKNLKMTSVDLVPTGANQHAFVRLFKSKTEDEPEVINEEHLVKQIYANLVKTLSTMFKKGEETPNNLEGDEETDMKFDFSKMTDAEKATLLDFQKKFALEDGEDEGTLEETQKTQETVTSEPQETASNALHPEVKKALDEVEQLKKSAFAEVEELKKSLAIEQLKSLTKKYESLGKKPDELSVKLYELKKAGGTAYDDYVGLLDEQLSLVEKSGMFTEIGKNTEGGGGTIERIQQAAAEIRKAKPEISIEQAFITACEQNPELLAEYESSYNERRLV